MVPREETELINACRILFGTHVEVTPEFLRYIQPDGIKNAYRSRARECHPDSYLGEGDIEKFGSVYFLVERGGIVDDHAGGREFLRMGRNRLPVECDKNIYKSARRRDGVIGNPDLKKIVATSDTRLKVLVAEKKIACPRENL